MAPLAPALSYCVVNTNGREYLLACLRAIEATHPEGVEREVLVLDNASTDGSAAAVRALGGEIELIERQRPTGKSENDSTLLQRARGRYCLLLNEDSELRPGAAAALIAGARRRPAGGGGDPAAARLRGRPDPLRLALPRRRDGARRRPLPAPVADRAERRRGDAPGRVGAVERAAGAARGGGRGRLPRPRLLRLLRRVRLRQAARRRRLARALRPRAPRRSTTTSSPPTSPPGCRGSSNSTATATSTCESTTAPPPPAPCAG